MNGTGVVIKNFGFEVNIDAKTIKIKGLGDSEEGKLYVIVEYLKITP